MPSASLIPFPLAVRASEAREGVTLPSVGASAVPSVAFSVLPSAFSASFAHTRKAVFASASPIKFSRLLMRPVFTKALRRKFAGVAFSALGGVISPFSSLPPSGFWVPETLAARSFRARNASAPFSTRSSAVPEPPSLGGAMVPVAASRAVVAVAEGAQPPFGVILTPSSVFLSTFVVSSVFHILLLAIRAVPNARVAAVYLSQALRPLSTAASASRSAIRESVL